MKHFFLLFSLLSFLSTPVHAGHELAKELAKEIQCYFMADMTNYNLVAGGFSGEGTIYCDNGESVKAEFSGINVLSVGLSHANALESYIVFTGVEHIREIRGRYHGGGFQLSVPGILRVDLSAYTNGDVTLKWASPPSGLAIGIPYKTVAVRFLDKDIKPPSSNYKTALKILGDLKFFVKKEEVYPGFNYKSVGIKVNKSDLAKNQRFRFRYLIEEDGFIWNSDIREGWVDVQERSFKPFYGLIDAEYLDPGETYYFSVAYTQELPPVVYQYEITMPDGLGSMEHKPLAAKVKRRRELHAF